MRLALATPVPPDTPRPPLHQRATSLVLAVGVTFLVILALWSLNVRTKERPRFKGTILLDLKPDRDATDASKQQTPAKPEPRREAQARPTPAPPPRPVPQPPAVQLPVVHPYYIPLTREENDAADISRLPHAGPPSTGGTEQASTAGDTKPIGTAPDGQPLYPAQWYRRPTNAELNFYLPAHMPTEGWGLVACKTIDHYHVEDCVELGNSPPGSHLASAVRQAAWQFLVRPPRLRGKALVGTWVRILIEYHEDGSDDVSAH